MTVSSVATGYDGISLLAGNSSYIPSSFESIQTLNGTGSSGTISFTSIPQTYKHLQIRYIAASTRTLYNDNLIMQVNGVSSGSNYVSHRLFGNGSSASSDAAWSTTEITVGNQNLGSTGAGGGSVFGAGVIDILDYTSTIKNKTMRSFNGLNTNTADSSGSYGCVNLSSGMYYTNTNAITQIDFKSVVGGNFLTGTTFALYGVK